MKENNKGKRTNEIVVIASEEMEDWKTVDENDEEAGSSAYIYYIFHGGRGHTIELQLETRTMFGVSRHHVGYLLSSTHS